MPFIIRHNKGKAFIHEIGRDTDSLKLKIVYSLERATKYSLVADAEAIKNNL